MSTLLRGHGLGNDYLILEEGPPLTPDQVVRICDRHTGVGSDGILEPTPTSEADHGVRIWNPDGSTAEKSGNGLRIFAQWLHDHRDAGKAFTVSTGHDVVRCQILKQGVRIEMGVATARRIEVPLDVLGGDGRQLQAVQVDVGNPHCVVFVEDFKLPWRTIGATLENHPMFPRRTNVQFVRILEDRAHAKIWERGAGETLASGSSSCAVAAAAVHTGLLPAGSIEVVMEGGTLQVDVAGGQGRYPVVLTGPVELVCRIQLLQQWA